MNSQYLVYVLALLAATAMAADIAAKVEDSTESPIADMAMIGDADMKVSSERPPLAGSDEMMHEKDDSHNAQPHTVADFIIHPLIAFKPRSPEEIENVDGKQAAGSSTTTPSPWQLFGFNAGQGLGSLAGSVSGWINDRIQLPAFVDSPVRESTTTTTTTTTPRPDVVVRVQHKATTRRPLISITNRPHRRGNGGNGGNNNNLNFESDEDDDDEYDDDDDFQDNNFNSFNYNNNKNKNNNNNKNQNNHRDESEEDNGVVNRRRKQDADEEEDFEEEHNDNDSDNYDDESEDDDEEETEAAPQRQNNRRRPVQQNQRRRQQENRRRQQQRPYGTQRGQSAGPQRRRQPAASEEEEDDNEEFYYGERPAMKRSQSQTNFLQRGQQSLINQIRQLTRGQTPAEIGAIMRQSEQANKKKRRQQATLVVNRNGQTVYMAPELLNTGVPQYQVVKTGSQFPQPPLSVPLKRKGRPTQYITIPWSQLGIAPPDQIVSITEGVQSQPLILNIPQSAINSMQSPNRKKKRPVITPDAVPLLAEASLMDVFKPPRIPPSRHTVSTSAVHRPAAGMPVVIASKTKPSSSGNKAPASLPHRIRPATIVEKAPAMAEEENDTAEASDEATLVSNSDLRNTDKEFIIVGEDNEPGAAVRQVQPVYGESRFVYGGAAQPYFQRFAFRKGGRALEQAEPVAIVNTNEQHIPVQIVKEEGEKATHAQGGAEAQQQKLEPQVEGEHKEPSTEVVAPTVEKAVITEAALAA